MKKLLLLFLALSPLTATADLASLLAPIKDLEPAQKLNGAETESPGASKVEVAKQATPVRAEDVLPLLADTLLRHYGADGELRLTLLQNWPGVSVPNAAWEVELLRTPRSGLAARMVLPVRISCGDYSTDHQLVVNCRLFREVLAPVRKIDRGEALSPEDFEVIVRDILASPSPVVAASETVQNYESKQSLAPGKVLLWRDLDEKPVVRRGQVVEVIAEEGFMRISVKGEALESGKAGDYISVRNLTTRKNLQAQILDEQSVQVLF